MQDLSLLIFNRLEVFDNNKEYRILFDPITNVFFKIDSKTAKIIKGIKSTADLQKSNCKEKIGIEFNDIILYNTKLKDIIEKQKEKLYSKEQEKKNKKILDRLVISTTNSCNLNCAYCYAKGGDYGNNSIGNLTKKNAKKIIDIFFNQFEQINNIQLFGGEPLLNYNVIKFITEYLKNLKINNKISTLPHIGIVTNGTYFNDDLLHLFQKEQIKLTISLDGPKDIHNALRPYKGGGPSYDIIAGNIKKYGDCVSGIEATYTKMHYNYGYTIINLMDFFYNEFGFNTTHIPPVASSEEKDLNISGDVYENLLLNAFEYMLNTSIDKNKENTRILSSVPLNLENLIYLKNSENICMAGNSTLAVWANGDLYPCFMFFGNEKFKYGNIEDRNIFSQNGNKIINSFNQDNSKEKNEKCSKCYAKNICRGCMGYNYKNNVFSLQDSQCKIVKNALKLFLFKYIEFSENPQNYSLFKKRIGELYSK